MPDDETPVVHAGERWYLTVRLKRPHGTVNPGGFDLEAWLLQQGLRATGYVHPDGLQRAPGFLCRAARRLRAARARAHSRTDRQARCPDAPYAGVIVALAIGDQRAIPEAQWTVFNRTGIAHLVSISGLHVTVFAAFAGGIAYALWRGAACAHRRASRRAKLAAVVGVVAAGGYVLLAGAEVPAVRTFAMLAIAACGLWLGRPGHRGHRVAVGACGRSAVGSVGDADAWVLAFLRRGRPVALRVGRTPACRAPAGVELARLRDARCARARTRNGSSRWDWRR